MSAEILRQAATLMRAERRPVDEKSRCSCEDDGDFTDSWFDRSICPEPCGAMHNICVECGYPQGGCAVLAAGKATDNRLSRTWLAVADWLDETADHLSIETNQYADGSVCLAVDAAAADCSIFESALVVARAYLGESADV